MNLELDHFFILAEPNAPAADALLSMGLQESFSRDHAGQGTSNRRFLLSNGMIEFLWVRDAQEAKNGPGRDLLFSQRAQNPNASPFGVILKRADNTDLTLPFDGWSYQPDYFKPPMAFHVGSNANNITEPLCLYVPFMEPAERHVEAGTLKSISQVCIHCPSQSSVLKAAQSAERLTFIHGKEHLVEVTFDNNQKGLSRDLRPALPLIMHW
jgi:hypothetical protein